MENPNPNPTSVEKHGVVAVYRLRDDGDADLIAAFDRQNCEGWFEDNYGDGADRLCEVVKEGLEFDGEEVIIREFAHTGELVDVLEFCAEKGQEPSDIP